LRQLSNFFSDFVVDVFVVVLEDADAALSPTTKPAPDTAKASTTAIAEQNRPRARRDLSGLPMEFA
jgi:hypothetical protein